jgi:PiT family inorganic phosphate transporter
MLAHVEPSSAVAIGILIVCLILVFGFEATNGFHDTANAVATVIYTNALRPTQAVVWSGIMNFIGVLVGGIAVAYALVELLPPDVLSPPDGSPAVTMLVALFVAAGLWNIGTWWFGIPNSSSHCIIGALIGVSLGNALLTTRPLHSSVDWSQVWTVLRALAVSPILGLVLAGLLYLVARLTIRDRDLYEQPKPDTAPTWWVRALLILTCTSVSFSHGTNDGQKSIGLMMLTIIGLFPVAYAINPGATQEIAQLGQRATPAIPLIQKFGDDQKDLALKAVENLNDAARAGNPKYAMDRPEPMLLATGAGTQSPSAAQQAGIRNDIYRIIAEMKKVESDKEADAQEKSTARKVRDGLHGMVEYAPYWVRIASAFCLGLGTMFGYRRVVRTLGQRIGHTHLTPAKGASAELVAAALIGTAGFTGLPVSTTHIVTSGIAGTMLADRHSPGLQRPTVTRILLAWVLTLPVTIAMAAGLFYLLQR